MSRRTRFYVLLALTAIPATGYSRLSSGWSWWEFYAGFAGLITVLVLVGLPWVEYARDGAFRRPHERSG